MPKSDTGYPQNLGVDSISFKDDALETKAKTNNRHPVHLLLIGNLPLAWTEHTPSPLFAHYIHTYSRMRTYPHINT